MKFPGGSYAASGRVWLGGVGVLSGVPVWRVEFSSSGPVVPFPAMVKEFERALPPGMARPRWASLCSASVEQAGNEFLLALRSRLGLLVHVETSGLSPMVDPASLGGRLPLWDHVCLRPSLPVGPIRCELFHSVVIDAPGPLFPGFEAFSAFLDKHAFSGPRFVVNRGPAHVALVRSFAAAWRLTAPCPPPRPAPVRP